MDRQECPCPLPTGQGRHSTTHGPECVTSDQRHSAYMSWFSKKPDQSSLSTVITKLWSRQVSAVTVTIPHHITHTSKPFSVQEKNKNKPQTTNQKLINTPNKAPYLLGFFLSLKYSTAGNHILGVATPKAERGIPPSELTWIHLH